MKSKPTSKARRPAKAPRLAVNPLLVNRVLLAQVLGCSTRHVFSLEADKVVVPTLLGKGGKASLYDLSLVVPAVFSHERNQRAPEAFNLDQERAQLARAQRIKTETENRRREGQLLERDLVVQEGQNFTKALTAKVRAIPRRLVQAGAVAPDQEGAATALCRELLIEIASWKTPTDTNGVNGVTQDPAA